MLEKFMVIDLATVGVAVGAVILAMFKDETINGVKALRVFHARPFDKDRDPDTPDRCQLFNEATGEWDDIIILKYKFSFNPDIRGAYIAHLLGETYMAKEKIPLVKWVDMRKRHMPEEIKDKYKSILNTSILDIGLGVLSV
jgi:hypothetical protein